MRFPITIRRGSISTKVYRTVRKDDGREVFRAVWHAGGVRTMRQFASYAQAHAEASLKADQLAAGKVNAAANLSGEDAAALVEARRYCDGVPILSALKEWAEARRLTGGQILPAARAYHAKGAAPKQVTVAEAVTTYLAEKKARGHKPNGKHEFYFNNEQRGLVHAIAGPISSVSATALGKWMEAQFPNAGSYNTARKRIVALWRWARLKRFLPQDSLTEAERVPSKKEDAHRREIISPADFARVLTMLRTAHPDYLASAVLAGFCGMRRDEIHAQKWSDVNLQAARLAVSAAKGGTPEDRLVDLCPAAVEWLLLCQRKGELVAPSYAQDRIRAFCRAAKPPIPTPENAFRHSYVSYRVALSGNVAETAIQAGNSSNIIHKHYRKPVSKEDGQAWFGIRPGAAGKVIGIDGKARVA